MKIIFINPPFTNYVGGIKGYGGKSMPLNLTYLASYLISKGYENTSILDAEALELSYEQVLEHIKKEDPDIIGFTSPTPSFQQVVDLSNLIKQQNPHVKIIIGGPHSSALPLDTAKEPSLDFVCFGEGELTMLELVEFIEKGRTDYDKIDGLIYKEGEKIIQNKQRKLTENLKMIESIPLYLTSSPAKGRVGEGSYLEIPSTLEVRGEVLMRKSIFEKLNKEQIKKGLPVYANTRNVAAGSLRQLDPQLVKERHLDFFAYDMYVNNLDSKEHSAEHEYLRNLGFNVEKTEAVCHNLKEVINFIKKFEKIRAKFPFGTDGIVVSVNDLKLQEILGVVGKAPRYMVAYKYPAEKATTIVKDIKVNVGRNKKRTSWLKMRFMKESEK